MYPKFLYVIVMVVCGSFIMQSCTNPKEVSLLYDAKAGVGEGALWDAENNRLLWIDITGKNLYVYKPDSSAMHVYPVTQEIGTVVPIDENRVLLGVAKGFFTYDFRTETLHAELIPDIDTNLVRFNDGKCAPDGSLWIGTMHHGVSDPVASLYKVSNDFAITQKVSDVTVSNGIAWSVDGTKMYYIDSPTYSVREFEYDTVRGDIGESKIVIETPVRWGTPDGSTIDEEGMLWIAHWGHGIVSRWNPSNGELLDTLTVPAPNVTSVAFGGKDKDVLFITTARNWMNEENAEEKYPNAGGLFIARPGVKGINAKYFR